MAGLWFVFVMSIMVFMVLGLATVALTVRYMCMGERPLDALGHALHTLEF